MGKINLAKKHLGHKRCDVEFILGNVIVDIDKLECTNLLVAKEIHPRQA